MTSSSELDVFGVRIDGLSADEVLRRADEAAATERRSFWIVTANPEILLYARSHEAYRDTINQADLRIVDGFGLKLAGLMRGRRLQRTTGVDLAQVLINRAAERNEPVAFLGGGPDVAGRALEYQKSRLPNLCGLAFNGGTVNESGEGDAANEEARDQISIDGPQILLVAFGHPKQELWIARHLNEFPSVRVVMGIGGAFDYWARVVPRAPRSMRTLGLEWLNRLIREPRRWRRIWKAVVIFPLLFLSE